MRVVASALKDTLVVLDLGNNSIGNLGAQSLTQLTRLQRLDLMNNGITAAGAAAIGKISTLRHLNMSGNYIKDEGCGHLAALPSLQSLNIISVHETPAGLQSLTRLVSTLQQLTIFTRPGNDDMSASLAHFRNLTFLHWHADCTGFIEVDEAVSQGLSLTSTTALSSLKQLQRLSLSRHLALGVGSDALAGLAELTRLTYLDLDYVVLPPQGLRYLAQIPLLCELTIWVKAWGATDAALPQLTALTKLAVSANDAGEGAAAYVSELTNLRHLSFNGSDMRVADHIGSLTGLTCLDLDMHNDRANGDLLVSQLAGLRDLQTLNIPRVGVGAAGAAEVAKLTKLTHLDISSNLLGNGGAAWVANLTNLTYLDIRYNAVGAAGAAELAQLTKLTYLDISGSNFGPEDAKVLSSSLTRLVVKWGI